MMRHLLFCLVMATMCIIGCGKQQHTPNQETDTTVDRVTCCSFDTHTISETAANRFVVLEQQLLDALAELDPENAQSHDDLIRRQTICVEVWCDLAWLRSRIGDTDGAQDAARQAIQQDSVSVQLLHSLAQLPHPVKDELLSAGDELLDPDLDEVLRRLQTARHYRLSDLDRIRIYRRTLLAGFYAYFDSSAGVESCIYILDPEKFWGRAFRVQVLENVCYAHLLAGRVEQARDIFREIRSLQDSDYEPPLTTLFVMHARALRCAGRGADAMQLLNEISSMQAEDGKALAMLAYEWGLHGEEEQRDKTLSRLLELHAELEFDQDTQYAYSEHSFERFVAPLLATGFTTQAQAIINHCIAMNTEPRQTSHYAMWQFEQLARMQAAAFDFSGAESAAKQSLQIAQEMGRSDELPRPCRIVLAAVAWRDTLDSAGFAWLVSTDSIRPELFNESVVDARDAVRLSGSMHDLTSHPYWDLAPASWRCGALLGQLHILADSDVPFMHSAIVRALDRR